MSPGMLLFDLFDSAVAFFLVYYIVKAKFGGDTKSIARTLAAVFGTITFIAYFAVIVWFNTYPVTVGEDVKMVVYLAPIVLSILMLILIQLSKPHKITVGEEDEEQNENEAAEAAPDEESDESDQIG
ncbi:MAG: hypothetical protein K5639_07495 [Eubacterium sp.]|nr:hypothetical protein [Eubacterium sp.]